MTCVIDQSSIFQCFTLDISPAEAQRVKSAAICYSSGFSAYYSSDEASANDHGKSRETMDLLRPELCAQAGEAE